MCVTRCEDGNEVAENTLINRRVYSAHHIQNVLLREEINLTAEWMMGLNTRIQNTKLKI